MKFRLIENKILKESEQPEHLYYVANSKYNGEFISQEEGHHFCTTLEDAINILPQLSKTKDSIYQYDLIKPLEPMVSDFDFTYWCGPIIAEFLIYKIQDKTYTFPDGITVVPPSAFHIDTLVPEDIDVLLPIAQLEHETVESFDEIMKFLAKKGFNSIEYHPMENNIANIAYLLPNDIDNYVTNKQLVWQKEDEIIIESAQNNAEYDNEGNQLTPEQSSFFKNSKVRDEKGRLIPCYHGTLSRKKFTEFNTEMGTNVNAIYFTDNRGVAHHWSSSGNTRLFNDKKIKQELESIKRTDNDCIERLLKLLNILGNKCEIISNDFGDDVGPYYRIEQYNGVVSTPLGYKDKSDPLVYNRYNHYLKDESGHSTRDEKGHEIVDFSIIDKSINLFDWLMEKVETEHYQQFENETSDGIYKCYLNIINPLEIDAKKNPYWKIPCDYLQIKGNNGKILSTTNSETIAWYAQQQGYDGVIIKDVYETDYENALCTDYIVFKSSQIKSVDNDTPTNSANINEEYINKKTYLFRGESNNKYQKNYHHLSKDTLNSRYYAWEAFDGIYAFGNVVVYELLDQSNIFDYEDSSEEFCHEYNLMNNEYELLYKRYGVHCLNEIDNEDFPTDNPIVKLDRHDAYHAFQLVATIFLETQTNYSGCMWYEYLDTPEEQVQIWNDSIIRKLPYKEAKQVCTDLAKVNPDMYSFGNDIWNNNFNLHR